jgi:SAM-dependent methyltransferase
MSTARTARTLAFGVEPGHAPYRLRQARYWELGHDVARFARERFQATGRRSDLLDVGVYDGVSRRYIEDHEGAEHVNFHGVDIFPHGRQFVYKHRDWALHHCDLEQGMPSLESNAYDIVLCEQVLEHLHDVEPALSDLARVLKPGGLIVLGVPIFPDGLHLVRRHIVPWGDALRSWWTGRVKYRGHVQAFSKRSFLAQIRRTTSLAGLRARGFRVVSGGILRPLESMRWWWRWNRRLGQIVPALCIEVQVTATKRAASGAGGPAGATILPLPRRDSGWEAMRAA